MSTIAQRIASLGLYDPDATAWVLAVRTAGASVSVARARQVSTLVNALKAANIWNSLDRLWLHAAENATQALIDLKARATATAVNSPTFTTDRGYKCNGTSSYLDLLFNPATALSPQYVRDDASFGGWVVTASTINGGVDYGNDYSAVGTALIIKYGGNNTRANIGASTGDLIRADGGAKTGLHHIQRTGRSAGAHFRNGASVGSLTSTSVAPTSKKFGVGAYIGAGASTFSDGQHGATFIGAGLAGKESAFYTPMRTYMTAVGVP